MSRTLQPNVPSYHALALLAQVQWHPQSRGGRHRAVKRHKRRPHSVALYYWRRLRRRLWLWGYVPHVVTAVSFSVLAVGSLLGWVEP